MNLILGAGLAGLSASYHLGHEKCRVVEKKAHPFGHIHSEFLNGFTWDEGPHVSFTKSDYVKELFAQSVAGEFQEYPVRTGNYFQSHWIDHPAQSNLYQVPEPLRSACIESFLQAGEIPNADEPAHYQEWLDRSLGKVFAETFSAAYTRKYWTVSPDKLTWKWVGPRVFRPKPEDILAGSQGPLPSQTHYITQVRYPTNGGYQAFAGKLAAGAHVKLNAEVTGIDLSRRVVHLAEKEVAYSRLINTLPLPTFIDLCVGAPAEIRAAAEALSCSSLLLVNVEVAHPTARSENWIYVYDEDKWSTRINCTELLSSGNAPKGRSGIQVEVYFSRYRSQTVLDAEIAEQVVGELIEMGLILPSQLSHSFPLPNADEGTLDYPTIPPGTVRSHTRKVPWANVIFDHAREPALDVIWNWLEQFGLAREADDREPFTNWSETPHFKPGALAMAGRFAQWKYFWTDDCVLRGRAIAGEVKPASLLQKIT